VQSSPNVGFGDHLIKGLMNFWIWVTGLNLKKGEKGMKRWPLIVWRGFLGLKTSFKFILYFEFEYRTSRTVNRDTNSGMDETKCLKIFSETKIIPATYDPSARCLSLEHIFLGTSEFDPEHISPKHWLHLLESKSNPSIQVWSDSLWE
jgi:hypothetical protein